MAKKNRESQEVLNERYIKVADYWSRGFKIREIASFLDVRPQDVYRYKRSPGCKKLIEELGVPLIRYKVTNPSKRSQQTAERVKLASDLSREYKKEGLSNIQIIHRLAKELDVNLVTIYIYLQRDDWQGEDLVTRKRAVSMPILDEMIEKEQPEKDS